MQRDAPSRLALCSHKRTWDKGCSIRKHRNTVQHRWIALLMIWWYYAFPNFSWLRRGIASERCTSVPARPQASASTSPSTRWTRWKRAFSRRPGPSSRLAVNFACSPDCPPSSWDQLRLVCATVLTSYLLHFSSHYEFKYFTQVVWIFSHVNTTFVLLQRPSSFIPTSFQRT